MQGGVALERLVPSARTFQRPGQLAFRCRPPRSRDLLLEKRDRRLPELRGEREPHTIGQVRSGRRLLQTPERDSRLLNRFGQGSVTDERRGVVGRRPELDHDVPCRGGIGERDQGADQPQPGLGVVRKGIERDTEGRDGIGGTVQLEQGVALEGGEPRVARNLRPSFPDSLQCVGPATLPSGDPGLLVPHRRVFPERPLDPDQRADRRRHPEADEDDTRAGDATSSAPIRRLRLGLGLSRHRGPVRPV